MQAGHAWAGRRQQQRCGIRARAAPPMHPIAVYHGGNRIEPNLPPNGQHPLHQRLHGRAENPAAGVWARVLLRAGYLASEIAPPSSQFSPVGSLAHAGPGVSRHLGGGAEIGQPRCNRAHVHHYASERGNAAPCLVHGTREPQDDAKPMGLLHTLPCERGGLTMVGLSTAMKHDALQQENLAVRLGKVLDRTVPQRLLRSESFKEFDGPKRCTMPPGAFLMRMLKYSRASPCCVVVAMTYLERLNEQHPSLCFTAFNIQRLLLVLMMLASKYLDDYFVSNKQWAMIGDLQTRELNHIELRTLNLLGFRLNITRGQYEATMGRLEKIDSIAASAKTRVTGADSEMPRCSGEIGNPSEQERGPTKTAVQDKDSRFSVSVDSIPTGPSPRLLGLDQSLGDYPVNSQPPRHQHWFPEAPGLAQAVDVEISPKRDKEMAIPSVPIAPTLLDRALKTSVSPPGDGHCNRQQTSAPQNVLEITKSIVPQASNEPMLDKDSLMATLNTDRAHAGPSVDLQLGPLCDGPDQQDEEQKVNGECSSVEIPVADARTSAKVALHDTTPKNLQSGPPPSPILVRSQYLSCLMNKDESAGRSILHSAPSPQPRSSTSVAGPKRFSSPRWTAAEGDIHAHCHPFRRQRESPGVFADVPGHKSSGQCRQFVPSPHARYLAVPDNTPARPRSAPVQLTPAPTAPLVASAGRQCVIPGLQEVTPEVARRFAQFASGSPSTQLMTARPPSPAWMHFQSNREAVHARQIDWTMH